MNRKALNFLCPSYPSKIGMKILNYLDQNCIDNHPSRIYASLTIRLAICWNIEQIFNHDSHTRAGPLWKLKDTADYENYRSFYLIKFLLSISLIYSRVEILNGFANSTVCIKRMWSHSEPNLMIFPESVHQSFSWSYLYFLQSKLNNNKVLDCVRILLF